MKRERNKGNGKLSKLDTYSTKEATYIIKRSTNRRSLKIAEFIRKTDAEYLTPNFALTIVWHALKTAGDRRDGNILGMPTHKRQEHFLRKIRTLAQRLGFSVIYVWIRSVGSRMGEHLHMALYWRHSAFLDLIKLMEVTLGSDVDHEAKSRAQFYGRSQCRGWEIKQILGGISGAFRWGEYLARQRIKHNDLSSGRRMGCSTL